MAVQDLIAEAHGVSRAVAVEGRLRGEAMRVTDAARLPIGWMLVEVPQCQARCSIKASLNQGASRREWDRGASPRQRVGRFGPPTPPCGRARESGRPCCRRASSH